MAYSVGLGDMIALPLAPGSDIAEKRVHSGQKWQANGIFENCKDSRKGCSELPHTTHGNKKELQRSDHNSGYIVEKLQPCHNDSRPDLIRLCFTKGCLSFFVAIEV